MNTKHASRILLVSSLALSTLWSAAPVLAQSSDTLEQRIKKVMDRPEFAHSRFGLKFIAADTGDTVYELNPAQLFVPGSTTKTLSEGTMLETLGGDYRFHTKIYRTGPIDKKGHAARRPGAGSQRRFEFIESHPSRRHAGIRRRRSFLRRSRQQRPARRPCGGNARIRQAGRRERNQARQWAGARRHLRYSPRAIANWAPAWWFRPSW